MLLPFSSSPPSVLSLSKAYSRKISRVCHPHAAAILTGMPYELPGLSIFKNLVCPDETREMDLPYCSLLEEVSFRFYGGVCVAGCLHI
jgi:hypothetical protein